ncbi:MAG TPA: alpha-amylase family glycosyl hydrolase, partial [Actinotalea sp.]|nr:alpha-amylase family glycosyl hydrolase [Actinotalea sp.]
MSAPVDPPSIPPPPTSLPAGTGAEREVMFRARVARWWPDLLGGLSMAYGPDRAVELGADLLDLAAAAFAARPDRLHVRDLERMLRPDWLQDPSMVGYAAYTERFAGDLRGIVDHLPYLDELGVRYLHLMPLLRPRDGDSDGGYAVADYRSVRPDLGTMDDLEHLAARLHDAGMSLVLDLVLNHVAREHE